MNAASTALVIVPLFGLAVGSFTNVIIDRLPVGLDTPNEFGELWDTRPWGEVLGGTSRCSNCAIPIRPIDNIPIVSFMLLRGRCRGCGDPIPRFHPIVEFIVPAIAFLAIYSMGLHLALVPVLWLIAPGVAISVIDLRTLMVPTRLVWPTFLISVVVSGGIALAERSALPLLGAAIGTAVLAGPLFAVWWIHPKGMGFGDVRLAVLIGWNVGFAALLSIDRPMGAVLLCLICLTIAAVLGIVVGVALQAGFGRPIPFGPSLMAAALICMIFAEPILRPYR